MAQLRFQIHGRLAGSAARDAEQEAPAARAADFRVRAGSAARDAEERKRAEAIGVSTSGFSLRAQNGNIQRVENPERVGGSVMPPAKNNNVATYKASDSEGVARFPLSSSAPMGSCEPSATSSVEASPAQPEVATSSILRRIFSAFEKNS